jgi:3-deoxy-D-manno-octulosonic-acid transferase
LVLDSFGILKYAYRYSRIAYVGGGFGKGIHNILEPVVYQIPVIFGPKHQAFPEAGSLIEMKGGFCISHLKDWDAILRKLHPTAFRQQCGVNASSYIAENMGTTEKILPYLFTALDHHEQGSYA